ncbi:hypothetical protein [Mycobacteroides immunogenum]|nr:hypothetical protein [Mycobacteroides immunogenum]
MSARVFVTALAPLPLLRPSPEAATSPDGVALGFAATEWPAICPSADA